MAAWNTMNMQWKLWFGTKQEKHDAAALTSLWRAAYTNTLHPPNDDDRRLLDSILQETTVQNRNNLTRTAAYLDYYLRNPEVHWALLAHVVSRNGGYGMTDLQGEWFRRMAKTEHSQKFFAMLERINFLIFRDAFPQLLLYAKSKEQQKDLSALLPELGVSRFMMAIWNQFHQTQDSAKLSEALIVNEQSFIEERAVQHPKYQQTVLTTAQYRMESLLDLNHIVIPYKVFGELRVAGTTVEHFVSRADRIRTGKRLYQMLFQDRLVHEHMVDWFKSVRHTGSRSDYLPEVFSPDKSGLHLQQPYQKRFSSDTSFRGTHKLYSPVLTDVWEDVCHSEPEPGDWFRRPSDAIDLIRPVANQPLDFTTEYWQGLRTTDMLVATKSKADDWTTNQYTRT